MLSDCPFERLECSNTLMNILNIKSNSPIKLQHENNVLKNFKKIHFLENIIENNKPLIKQLENKAKSHYE